MIYQQGVFIHLLDLIHLWWELMIFGVPRSWKRSSNDLIFSFQVCLLIIPIYIEMPTTITDSIRDRSVPQVKISLLILIMVYLVVFACPLPRLAVCGLKMPDLATRW